MPAKQGQLVLPSFVLNYVSEEKDRHVTGLEYAGALRLVQFVAQRLAEGDLLLQSAQGHGHVK